MPDLTALSFDELKRRLTLLGVSAQDYGDTVTFYKQAFRMGLGTTQWYSVAYHGGDGIVHVRTIHKLLDDLQIHDDDWHEAGQAQPRAPDAQAGTAG